MMNKAWLRFSGLLCLALIINACNKCDECADEFNVRLQFSDINNNSIFTDLDPLLVTDLAGEAFEAERIVEREDTIFNIALRYEDPQSLPPDTIVIFYDNVLIDTAATEFGFTNDSDCCDNVFIIDNVRFFNRQVNRVIRPGGRVSRIIIGP